MKTTVLGAGLAGISASWHIGHENCVIFEKSLKYGGHAGSESKFGFTYDHGPHVSFTKHAYVRELFEKNTNGKFEEYPVRTRNYYQGSWIEHPAQAHLWQVPEPIRDRCARNDFRLRSHSRADLKLCRLAQERLWRNICQNISIFIHEKILDGRPCYAHNRLAWSTYAQAKYR